MKQLRIGIDVHSIGSQKGGNETYYRELVRGIGTVASEHSFILYHTNSLQKAGLDSGGHFRTKRLRPANPLLRIPLTLPWRAKKENLDVFHAQYILPPFLHCKTVVSIFDLAHERYPEFFHPREARAFQALFRWSARRADQVITVSNFSARDLVEIYGVKAEKITVTHLAASEQFRPLDPGACREYLDRKYRLNSRFILYAGRLQARKNLVRLIKAYAQVQDKGAAYKLVIVGKPDWQAEEVFECVRQLNLRASVVFLGYVPGEDLPMLYNAAEVFAFPSIFEGYGLPVMESMACGTPTITSYGSSLEEVAGGAALLVDPLSVSSIAGALQCVLEDEALRAQLKAKGLARSAQYSYRAVAEQTVKAYESM